jgi:cob(I)alamin adenosyltransferase
MKVSGRVAFRDLEGGVWVLEGDDGQTYQLADDRRVQKDGKRIEVEGEVDSQAVGIGMVGPLLSVRRFRFL